MADLVAPDANPLVAIVKHDRDSGGDAPGRIETAALRSMLDGVRAEAGNSAAQTGCRSFTHLTVQNRAFIPSQFGLGAMPVRALPRLTV
jgi:hypothetical protein